MRTIPARFELMGHTIEVVMVDTLWDDAECHGRWIAHKNRIELQKTTKQNGMSFSFLLATFWHEVAHAICTHCGMPDLNNDEEKIDLLGQGIAQVLRTKRNK